MKKLFYIIIPFCFFALSCKKTTVEPEVQISPPVARIISPVANDNVFDSLRIQIEAVDDKGIMKVEIYIDGVTDSSKTLYHEPFEYLWLPPQMYDSSKHSIYAKVIDVEGNITTTPICTVSVFRVRFPTMVYISSLTDELLTVNWNDNSFAETGYAIEVSNGSKELIKTTLFPSNTTAASVEGLFLVDSVYFCRVIAQYGNKIAPSTYTSRRLQFAAPQISYITYIGDTVAQIVWQDNSTFESGFEIEIGDDESHFVLMSSTIANITNAFLPGIYLTTKPYYFRLRAKTVHSTSAYSDVISEQPPFPEPGNLSFQSLSLSHGILKWNNNASFSTGYIVERAVNKSPLFAEIRTTSTATSPDTALATDDEYTYRVKATSRYNTSIPSQPYTIWCVPDSGNLVFQKGGYSGEAFGPVAVSSDKKYAAFGAGHFASTPISYSVFVVQLSTKQVIHNLTGHLFEISSIQFSPDGQTIAAGDHNGSIKIWNVASGIEKITCMDSAKVTSLEFSPDGKFFASGSTKIRIHNVSNGEVVQYWDEPDLVNDIRFSSDGNSIVAALSNGFIVSRNVSTGVLQQSHQLPGYTKFRFSVNGEFVAGIKSDKIVVLKMSDNSIIREFAATSTSATVSNDGKLLTFVNSGYPGSSLGFVYDIKKGLVVKKFEMGGPYDRIPLSIGSSPDGLLIASGCGGLLSTWQLQYQWNTKP